MKKIFLVTAAGLLVATAASAAQAGTSWGFSYSNGYAPVYTAPRSIYIAPRPVYVAPQPIYYYGPGYYAPYTPSFRVNYWNGNRRGDWHRGRDYGHGRGHGHHRH